MNITVSAGSRMVPTYVIGLTGNIASGKSAVVAMLHELGAGAIDADLVYHELIQPGRPLWTAVKARFGASIIGAGGQIDRKALGGIVFRDAEALADLEALTHPAVIDSIRQRLKKATDRIVVVDAIKLIESGATADCDEVWVVYCQPEQQIERLMRRNGLSRAEAEQRVSAQPPIEPKLLLADVVIDNSGPLPETRRLVEAAWRARGHPARLSERGEGAQSESRPQLTGRAE